MGTFKIGWNDGHTLSGPGTGASGIIKETDRNRRIGSKARQILLIEYENVEIINCTIDYSSNDMYEAVTRANNAGCNLFVSNHVNAGGGVGFETLYSRKSTQANINAAKIIHKHLVATKSCLKDRRCTDDFSFLGYDLYVLVNTKMDAVLCEIGFVDNQACANAVNDDEVARAYASGIAEAYGLKKKAITQSNTEVQNIKVVEERKFDMKNLVVYGNSVDRRAAEYLADYLQCPTLDGNIPFDYSKVENVYCVGGEPSLSWTGYAKKKITGTDRFDTIIQVLKFIKKI